MQPFESKNAVHVHEIFAPMKFSEDIPSIARLLGFDASLEPQYLWIARLASEHVLDPDEWKEFTGDKGRVVYYNAKLKVYPNRLPELDSP